MIIPRQRTVIIRKRREGHHRPLIISIETPDGTGILEHRGKRLIRIQLRRREFPAPRRTPMNVPSRVPIVRQEMIPSQDRAQIRLEVFDDGRCTPHLLLEGRKRMDVQVCQLDLLFHQIMIPLVQIPLERGMERVVDDGTLLFLLVVMTQIPIHIPVFERQMPAIDIQCSTVSLRQLIIKLAVQPLKDTHDALSHLLIR